MVGYSELTFLTLLNMTNAVYNFFFLKYRENNFVYLLNLLPVSCFSLMRLKTIYSIMKMGYLSFSSM